MQDQPDGNNHAKTPVPLQEANRLLSPQTAADTTKIDVPIPSTPDYNSITGAAKEPTQVDGAAAGKGHREQLEQAVTPAEQTEAKEEHLAAEPEQNAKTEPDQEAKVDGATAEPQLQEAQQIDMAFGQQ